MPLGYPATSPLSGVAGIRRNARPTSLGMGGRLASESVAGFARNTQSDDYWLTVTDFLTPTSLYYVRLGATLGRPGREQ